MKDNDLYFLQLTVYQYDKNKTKMDYSIIPVTFKDYDDSGLPISLKSGVSDEVIDIKYMLFSDTFLNRDYQEVFGDSLVYLGEIHDKKKEGKAVKTSILVYNPWGLEDEEEDVMKRWLKHFFRKRWFYKFKYLKFLKKKEELNQF
jgi:hypothetical protein